MDSGLVTDVDTVVDDAVVDDAVVDDQSLMTQSLTQSLKKMRTENITDEEEEKKQLRWDPEVLRQNIVIISYKKNRDARMANRLEVPKILYGTSARCMLKRAKL
jgi:hypothetical protein